MAHLPAAGSHRPAQLDDAEWLTSRLQYVGTMSIALELGVSRKTVRLACERLDIPSQPTGRRRGSTTGQRATNSTQAPAIITEAAELFAVQAASGSAPASTWTTVLGHLAAADQARKSNNRTMERSAAVALAVSALRVAAHIDQVDA